jgi:phage gp36-like protein
MATRYLTVAEMIERIGEQEAVRLTSEHVPPAVPARNDAKIEAAIGDSEDEADGYISRRYALPLPATPKVLKTWVAALAREKLHKTRPTPAVEDAANRARAQLKEVSTGVFILLPAEAVQPKTIGDRLSISSGDGPRDTFADSLSDFTNLRGDGYSAAWRG